MRGPVRFLAVLALAALPTACSSQSPQPPDRAETGPVRRSGAAFEPCASPGGNSAAPASAAVQTFGAGGTVESAIEEDLDLKRNAIRLESRLVKRDGDESTTLSSTASLQSGLLDGPSWSHRAVGDVARIAQQDCARAGGEVLAGIVSDLDAHNRTRQPRGIAAGRQVIEDLGADQQHKAPQGEPLLSAFRQVFAVRTPWSQRPASGTFAESEPVIRTLESALDPTTARRLAVVVAAMARAEEWRLAAVRAWYPTQTDFMELERAFSSREVPPPRARSFDYATMGRGGAALALVVERLQVQLAANPLPGDLDVTIATPLGEVVLSGRTSGDDRKLAAPALVVDQGGNDTYRGVIAGPAMVGVPLSVLIDLGGDDTYLGGEATGTQGAGVFSFGLLLDSAGNDRYEAKSTAQGAGVLGVGALYDNAGDDAYLAQELAQGAARFGLGAAVDLSGNDTWRITTSGQGFGDVRGVGLLLDAGGDDVFDANDTEITNPSPQTAEHNISLAQGAGFGTRAPDRATSMGGGLGLLVDLAGADRYSCGVFCQGAGYFFGHGILYDSSGNDTYRGVWYDQGSAAHFALGTLIDEAGNDSYETVDAGSRGSGHDESAGFFLEGGGDDRYVVAKRSNGATSNVGYGFFVDAGGADTYATLDSRYPGRYGQATIDSDFANYRGYEGARALGLFLDLAGNDDYEGAPAVVKNGANWQLPGYVSPGLGAVDMPVEQVGLGRDAE